MTDNKRSHDTHPAVATDRTAPSAVPSAAPRTALRLGLERHPEGGWFRQTWRGTSTVETANGPRPTATCIHYLLEPDEHSAWHVVSSDELWLWHGPGVLELSLGGSDDAPGPATTLLLGPGANQVAQGIVPAGTWQAARPVSGDEVLVTCFVSPGFDYADWRLADSSTLDEHPAQHP
jgi:predicted cupin superfamily sugar epimerase